MVEQRDVVAHKPVGPGERFFFSRSACVHDLYDVFTYCVPMINIQDCSHKDSVRLLTITQAAAGKAKL